MVVGLAAALCLGTVVFLALWWRRAAKKTTAAGNKGTGGTFGSISVFNLSFSARTKANIERVDRAATELGSVAEGADDKSNGTKRV